MKIMTINENNNGNEKPIIMAMCESNEK